MVLWDDVKRVVHDYLFLHFIGALVPTCAFILGKIIKNRGVSKMLEGKEVDQKFDGDAGEAIVDVDDKGGVEVSVSYSKKLDELLEAKAEIGLKTNIFKLAEKIAAKTATPWDDKAVAGLESLLGIKKDEAAPAAPSA